jgi:aryl carrier-like protein
LVSEAKSTEKDYNNIIYGLDSIRESILAGSYLEGWREEGILAGYEHKEE